MFALYKCMSSQLLWLDNTCSKQIDTKATITWWLSMFEVFNWRGGWPHPWLGEWEPEAAPFETALWDEGFAKVATLRKEKDKPCAVGLVDMCLHFACCKWFGSKYGVFQYCGLCCLWESYCTHILLDSFGYVKATWLHECSSYLVIHECMVEASWTKMLCPMMCSGLMACWLWHCLEAICFVLCVVLKVQHLVCWLLIWFHIGPNPTYKLSQPCYLIYPI